MWTRAQLKEAGKNTFKKSYKQAVIVCIIVYLISAVFDGGYNSANNNMQNTIIYDQYEENYIEPEFQDEEFIEGIEINNGVTETTDALAKFSPEGVIGNIFDTIMTFMSSSLSSIGIISIAVFMVGIMLVTTLIRILILNPIIIGKNNFFMGIRESERKIGDILFLFDKGKLVKPIITMFFVGLYIFLWTLLLVIPGLIKSYEYLMIEYILSENPNINRKRAFELSKYMMNGQKWNTFVLDLSFIGWNILSSITFGILGVFYVNPYIEATYAELYAVLRQNALDSGFADSSELPGFSLEV